MAKRLIFLSYVSAIVLALFLAVFGISNVYSDTSSDTVTCNSVEICSDYTISCSSVPDGYCPYNFADWNSLSNGKTCKTFIHNAGTENEFTDKCEICDPDCTPSGKKCFSLSSFNFREIQVATGR
ncbi:hypothetical protein J4405_06330 [Candidatus Woesearchaeota archaeon]|nr:hypothetical protein [Candidatus Woesearchaeota archaeon]